jgi:hypothetical protein
MALGVLLLFATARTRPSRRPLALASAAGVLVAVAAAMLTNRFDPQLLSSGVYRYGILPVTSGPGAKEVVFMQHGRTASVAVTRTGEGDDAHVAISTNGKPDGSLSPVRYDPARRVTRREEMGGDESTQLLLPLLSLAHAPRAASVAVIGHGTGMSSHVLLGSPHVRELYTIEIEPEMIAGSRAFYPANRRVFDDPRSHEVVDDAKSFFAASGKRFDFILSEPSNPWVSGVSGLFTAEFYGRVRRQLAPGGVFAQWLHLYEINDALVLTVLAALHQSFPDYQIYMTGGVDIIIVASADGGVPAPDWGVFEYPGIATDLRRLLPFTPRALEASWLVDRRTLAPLLDRWGQPNSDYYPVLDLGGERARFTGSGATGFTGLTTEPFDIVAALSGRRSPFTDEIDVPVPGITRMAALARGAMLRASVDSSVVEPTLRGRYNEAAQRGRRFRAMLADSEPPADWTLWLADAQAAYIDVHGGTAGVVDERFFADVRRYLDRHRAPGYVRDVVAFLHGLAGWDFQEAAAATDRLAPAVLGGAQFIGTGLFCDGAVVAKLKTHNPDDARRILVGMERRTGRRPDSFRTRLLAAYVMAAGARQAPLATGEGAPRGATGHSGSRLKSDE